MCITPDSRTYWKKLNFVDTTNGIKFTIDCLATAQSLGIEPKQFSHPQVQRVVEGWKAACGYANVEDGGTPTTGWRDQVLKHRFIWNQGIESDSIIGELKKIQELKALLTPSMLLSMPDPALLIDIYQGVLDYGVNTGALDKKNLAIYSTSGSDSLVSATDRDVEQTDGSTADVDRDDQEKTSISIDGDAGTTISTKLAEVTNSGETTKQVMQVLGGILDCGAAIAGAIVSGGVGTGGAVAACGKLVAGGASLTPYMPSPVPGALPPPELSPSLPPAAIKHLVNLYIKSTEHKTTRKPCEDFKAQVYHLGEYTGRAMDMLEEMEHGEADLIRNYGMKEAALREGLVYFSQMQCMQRVVLKYVRLPGPLLGVSTDAASLTCQGGETKLDKDEDKATLAIEKMITQWTQWLTSSGTDDAIRTRRMAERSATGPLAKIEPILDAVNEIKRASESLIAAKAATRHSERSSSPLTPTATG